MPWTLTIRIGPKVQRQRFGALEEALGAIEAHGEELAARGPQKSVDVRYKQFEPDQLIAARLELAGPERLLPSVRVGVDVRGDGSTEAYEGRVRRSVIEPRKGEGAFEALRRVLADSD